MVFQVRDMYFEKNIFQFQLIFFYFQSEKKIFFEGIVHFKRANQNTGVPFTIESLV